MNERRWTSEAASTQCILLIEYGGRNKGGGHCTVSTALRATMPFLRHQDSTLVLQSHVRVSSLLTSPAARSWR